MTIDWQYKTAAFLDAVAVSFLGDGATEEKRLAVQKSASTRADFETLRKLQQLREISAGFDRPPWPSQLPDSSANRQLVFRHLLSGTEQDIGPLPGAEELYSRLLARITTIVNKGDDPKKNFFRLWRLLPDPHDDMHLWGILPADPQMPSHTVWEHATVMAAFAGAGRDPAVLLFTIASAQDFVAAARRTQDSWMGSFLLSYLSWNAMRVIADKCGPDVIFSPSLRGQPLVDWWLHKDKQITDIRKPDQEVRNVASIPNIFLALIPQDRVESIAQACENEFSFTWQNVGRSVKKKMEKTITGLHGNSFWNTLWDRQLASFPDQLGIFWSSCAWSSDDDPLEMVEQALSQETASSDFLKKLQNVLKKVPQDKRQANLIYHLFTAAAGRSLTNRKGLRDFRQREEPGFKCSLCGIRQALAGDEHDGYGKMQKFWQKLASSDRRHDEGLKLTGRIRRGDKLCAVCLSKRLALEAYFEGNYLDDHHFFPSTAGLAATPFLLQCLDNDEIKPRLLEFACSARQSLKEHGLFLPATQPALVREKIRTAYTNEEEQQTLMELDGAWYSRKAWEIKKIRREYNLGDVAGSLTDDLKQPLALLKELLAQTGKTSGDNQNRLGGPPRYYAVVAMDGDKMSEWVTGKKGPALKNLVHSGAKVEWPDTDIASITRPMGPAMQLGLSSCLANFTLHFARRIVEKHGGVLIYAGGDDLLALFPAVSPEPDRGLVTALDEIYQHFTGGRTGFLAHKNSFLPVMGGENGMTLSMGVAVVHHAWPLYKAIGWAQDLLKHEAKETWDRNSFVLGALSRSGGRRIAGGKFGHDETGLLKTLSHISGFMSGNILSPRIGYRLGQCRWAMGLDSDWDTLSKPLEIEVSRLVRQHAKTENKEERQKIMKTVNTLYTTAASNHSNIQASSSNTPDFLENLSNLLIIAAFLGGREG